MRQGENKLVTKMIRRAKRGYMGRWLLNCNKGLWGFSTVLHDDERKERIIRELFYYERRSITDCE